MPEIVDGSGRQHISYTPHSIKNTESTSQDFVVKEIAGIKNDGTATFSEISFNPAVMAGDNLVKAAHATLTGAIAGHAAGLTLQGASTFRTVKALNKENRSLENNVKVAQIKQEQLSRESLHVESASNNINNPEGLGRRPLAMMRDSHPEINRESQDLMRLHEKVRNRTAEVNVIGSYTTQAGQATTGIIQAGAGTESASKNKQAELDKAGQQTSERTGDTHKQTATQSKETAERLLALFEKLLANQNDAITFIASSRA